VNRFEAVQVYQATGALDAGCRLLFLIN